MLPFPRWPFRPRAAASGDEPLPLALLNVEQLEAYARTLAAGHEAGPFRGYDRLLARLRDNEDRVLAACRDLSADLLAGVRVSPAGDWLLDNLPLIEEQIRLARRHLPRGYVSELPHLRAGPQRGFPRVYHLALEIIGHVDGRVDRENVTRFIAAYQEVHELSLGELWAVPIMLRLALIENLRRVAVRVAVALRHRAEARAWTERILAASALDPKAVLLTVADMARADPPLSNAFVAEFAQRLNEHGSVTDLPLRWLDHQLAELGTSQAQMLQAESRQQAANQVSVASSIGSLRFLRLMVWRRFVEDTSNVEHALRQDPAGVYTTMDFATRDRYRHAVEDAARDTKVSELAVAQTAVRLARDAPPPRLTGDPVGHVGYYLLDVGAEDLRRALTHPRARHRWSAAARRVGWGVAWFGTVFGVTGGATAWVLAGVTVGPLATALVAVGTAICASQLGVSLANDLATAIKRPELLPRLDLSEAIPDALRTLIVVPTLVTTEDQIERVVEDLEVRFLGNPLPNLSYALLSDLADADAEVTPTDADLIAALIAGVARLNAVHAAGAPPRFFLLHRPREWNPREKAWMGYERKRGKLDALNQLLRGRDRRAGGPGPSFSVTVGDLAAAPRVTFVLTVDSDTRLPRDAAHKLIGTLAHPLNRARLDPATGAVRAGYGILQPRVAIHLPSTRRSWYVRLYAGEGGVDPYSMASSDVYQDLFGQGSFNGKGLYDVDAFLSALEPQLPADLILSHDLIEGCFARSGLVSDVQLYEDHPSHYVEGVKRRRRWIRGDWQILFWLLPWAPQRDGRWRRNHLSWLSRWKIADNLRRSLLPIATLLLLVAALVVPTGLPHLAVAVVAAWWLPAIGSSLLAMLHKPPDTGLRYHLRFEAEELGRRAIRAGLSLVFLADDALNSLDAIARSSARMVFTRRGLLEWRSPAEATDARAGTVGTFYRTMALSVAAALALAAALWWTAPPSWPWGLGLAALWALAPAVAAGLSRPLGEATDTLTPAQLGELRRLARKTWSFFEVHVGPADHWLPPDNVQESPHLAIAHRTSPTNLGLSLLSALAAHDFGYLSTRALLDRTAKALDTMSRLERFRGHFYNWYDTQTLAPMAPLYVSSVDSGNLSAHLLTLAPGLRELADAPTLSPRAWRGLADAVDVLLDLAPDLAPRLAALRADLDAEPATLREARARAASAQATLDGLPAHPDPDASRWITALAAQCRDVITDPLAALTPAPGAGDAAAERWSTPPTWRDLARAGPPAARALAAAACAEAAALAARAEDLAIVEHDLLYDDNLQLVAIGYNVTEHRRDPGFYDLLASEARLGSFVAIAQGELPQAHWFALGRQLTAWRSDALLLSWSGSMFEYLMPLLVMPSFPSTLLDQTCRTMVRRQVAWGAQTGLPWGVSESGYSARDLQLNYQYKAFGVPGLGFKRGLSEDRVVAPYATVLALLIAPAAALSNLARLKADGFEGRYGFYEAIDYTPQRLSAGQASVVVRSFMAHHQGMSLLAYAWLLLDQPMQRRFTGRPQFKAAELLLHERIPKQPALFPHAAEVTAAASAAPAAAAYYVIDTPHPPRPEVHLLSNGRYSLMITQAGGGFSRWNGIALTRWREDPTCDDWGTFCYVRDVDTGELWSATHQPTGAVADRYQAVFSASRAEFRRRDHGVELHTEISVSPEDDVELRRLTFTNLTDRVRTLELTTYAEVVLAPQATDDAHPAFSNLFVHTELVPRRQAILCSRRPRSEDETAPVLLHLLAVRGETVGPVSYETDRRQFLGRGGSTATPPRHMTGTAGSVLDPIVAIRCRFQVGPEQSVTAHLVTGAGATRDEALALVDRYHDRHLADRVFDLAWAHRCVVLAQVGVSEADAQLYLRLASAVLYANPALRSPPATLLRSRRSQATLWAQGISGDRPIVVVRISTAAGLTLAREGLRAHGFWRLMGLEVDLVLSNEDTAGYQQSVQEQLLSLVSHVNATASLDAPGGVFIRRLAQLSDDDRSLLLTVARVVLHEAGGSLADQLRRRSRAPIAWPPLAPRRAAVAEPPAPPDASPPPLRYDNGRGGFRNDGREYRITTTAERRTPAPWSNVLANPTFGTLISESGGAYTWCENAHELRLTPWENDPVADRSGEALFLRDDESGAAWSPTPAPMRGDAPYVTRHTFGSSAFEHTSHGVRSELTVFVAIDAPVKLSLLKLTNRSDRPRTLTVFGYVAWVLGELRAASLLHLTTEVDPLTRAILARNPYHLEFGARIGFFACSEERVTWTGDRAEFIGRNGRLESPAALRRDRLSGRVGAGLDACAALAAPITLQPGESRELTFALGIGRDLDDVHTLLARFGRSTLARAALAEVRHHWDDLLGGVRVVTPDAEIDLLVNGWLPYQIIACRLWARTGSYQSGGAFGFRDQLQDAMSLVHLQPGLLRDQLLRASGRQFREGDVQHWWHPPSGRGVRTRCSDDLLWLPAATARYVRCVGDLTVLDVRAPFLEGRPLRADEEAYADVPTTSRESATLYEHCVLAIRHALRFGAHGLPLMGSGDWNDGMNLVGARGEGESVWLAWFLHDVLRRFADVAIAHGDPAFADTCVAEAEALAARTEASAWDGAWYRRAWFDSGEPLGSEVNAECQIDAIAQSWAVLSGAAQPDRAQAAMAALDERLVRRDLRAVLLLAPPFDTALPHPGYIRGYPPGVRENGGQYTHAAVWAAMAFARLGDWARAWELTRMINPILHAATPEDRERYRVEPYVLAADVYAVEPHAGLGGWTWQTGSAGWMYTLILESLLGLERVGDVLFVRPCVPPSWTTFTVHYRFGRTTYRVVARRAADGEEAGRATLDGLNLPTRGLPLVDDRQPHVAEVTWA